jgi:hypothetical protein
MDFMYDVNARADTIVVRATSHMALTKAQLQSTMLQNALPQNALQNSSAIRQ